MTSAGFEPTILAGERPQTYALDRVATGTGERGLVSYISSLSNHFCVVNLMNLTCPII
jgi:hypothetical protein